MSQGYVQPGETPQDYINRQYSFANLITRIAAQTGLRNLIPDVFPKAQQNPVVYGPQPQSIDWAGKFYPSINRVDINTAVPGYVARMQPVPQLTNRLDLQPWPTANPTDVRLPFSAMSTELHEAGHAIWDEQLNDTDKSAWNALHAKEAARQPSYTQPWAVRAYSDDPGHSFAESVRMYAQDPMQLKQEAPEMYNFLKSKFGFEYMRHTPPPKR